jgi:arginine/ornithine N-succinyltransferase beta subunit
MPYNAFLFFGKMISVSCHRECAEKVFSLSGMAEPAGDIPFWKNLGAIFVESLPERRAELLKAQFILSREVFRSTETLET